MKYIKTFNKNGNLLGVTDASNPNANDEKKYVKVYNEKMMPCGVEELVSPTPSIPVGYVQQFIEVPDSITIQNIDFRHDFDNVKDFSWLTKGMYCVQGGINGSFMVFALQGEFPSFSILFCYLENQANFDILSFSDGQLNEIADTPCTQTVIKYKDNKFYWSLTEWAQKENTNHSLTDNDNISLFVESLTDLLNDLYRESHPESQTSIEFYFEQAVPLVNFDDFAGAFLPDFSPELVIKNIAV